MPDLVGSNLSPFVSRSYDSVFEDPRHAHTCSRCRYSGPLQVRRFYPLLLRNYVIALAFCCGILPGLLLRRWRREAGPTVAVICPQCAFLRLELKGMG